MTESLASPVRLLVVDDHPMVREGLRSMLAGTDVTVVGEAGSGSEALRRIGELGPDVVLLDLELPDVHGLEVLRRIREAAPALPVLVVTMHEDPVLVRRAVRAGASGYVLKGIGRPELLASVRAVNNGGSVVDPGLLRAVVNPDHAADAEDTEPALSAVELDVLQLIADGLTNRQIAERLRWSQATVKKYIQRVLDKLDAPDRTRAAVEAVRRGLLR
jgi:DNA-binding NarL/FixJ family response regulator